MVRMDFPKVFTYILMEEQKFMALSMGNLEERREGGPWTAQMFFPSGDLNLAVFPALFTNLKTMDLKSLGPGQMEPGKLLHFYATILLQINCQMEFRGQYT